MHHARDLVSGHEVAIKVFHPHVWADEAFRARVRRERASLEALDHPNIVPILDAGESEGAGWIVMPLARAGSLDDRLKRGPIPDDEALRILRQVALALDAAHAAGHLHRDVKPANVLLQHDGHAWLADFGVTRPVGGSTTMPGQMVGTAAYMAPEVISGERPGEAADVYGFACMAFEVMTGRRPFPDDEMATVLFAHVDRPAPRASDVRPGLSPHMDRALSVGLAKDAALRPRTAAHLVDGIADAIHGGAGATVPMQRSMVRRARRWPRVTRATVLLTAGFAILGGSAAGFALMGLGPDAPEAAPAEVRPPQRIPMPQGSVAGTPAASTAIPGLRASDVVAATALGDDARAYAIDAGPGRTPREVAAAVTAALKASGLSVASLDLDGSGSTTLAWEAQDFLRLGHKWAVSEAPSVEKGRQDVVVAAEGSGTAPVLFMQGLASARPGTLLSP